MYIYSQYMLYYCALIGTFSYLYKYSLSEFYVLVSWQSWTDS